MLRLIQGGAKTGKSTRVREEILSLARQEDAVPGRLVLLVPEQFSYETERAYFTALGIRQADRVLVLSFQRLAEEMFREFRGSRRGRGNRNRPAAGNEAGLAGNRLCSPIVWTAHTAPGLSRRDGAGHVGAETRRSFP